jgi:hypothetical protein
MEEDKNKMDVDLRTKQVGLDTAIVEYKLKKAELASGTGHFESGAY